MTAPAAPETWATVEDVATYTGATVTSPQLMQANAMIEMFTRRTCVESYDRTGDRDKVWLKRAVAYQAAWMPGQPDVFTRLDVNTIQEGRKAIGLKENTLLIAPLAKKALRNVSWLKTRSVHVRSPFQDGLSPISPDPDSAGNDWYESWSPLGGW